MKKLAFLLCMFVMFACDNSAEPEIVVCPGELPAVQVLTVDYTTNEFLGGYTVLLPNRTTSLQMTCDYKSPGDFGSVRWYDKSTGIDLFAGTIVWMGKGERTFPEQFYTPDSFPKTNKYATMPAISLLEHDETASEHEVDYSSIWKGVDNLAGISWVNESTPAYIYLYTPSVGVGDPKDWYWVIFLKH